MNRNNKLGFTLVELLAVIVILAIILVIAVPKVMTIIEDSKKAILESTAKMIASSAEKAKVQNDVLGKTDKITCESVAKINNVDYQGCKIEFDDNGKALVTIIGNGKFKGYNVCKGSKNNSSAVEDSCSLVVLTINPDGGNLNKTFEEKYESGVIVDLAIPTKEGYTFSHWDVSGNNASVNNNKLTIGTTATEVTAIWTQSVYEISYNLDGGTLGNNSPTKGAIGEEIIIPEPTKEGYVFKEWTITGGTINGNKITMEASNVTLTVVWEPLAATYITNLLKEESTQNNGLKQTTAVVNNETVDAGIRYVGANPKNKVYFNCKDKDSNDIVYGEENYDYASSCEIWRIIGVFDVKSSKTDMVGAKRVKIVRDAFTDSNGNVIGMSWDSSASGTNSGLGINQWGKSTYNDGSEYEGADLMRMLNGYYIGTVGATCTYCNDANQGTCTNDCSNSITPLSNTTLSLLEDALWNLGAITFTEDITLLAMYTGERGMQNGKICTSGVHCTDKVVRTTEWIGKIGLIYPSDYGYASTNENCAKDIVNSNSTCNEDNWLHPSNTNWTLLPFAISNNANYMWYVSSSAHISTYYAYHADNVRPCLYLSSNVQIIGGDGNTIPFKLAI